MINEADTSRRFKNLISTAQLAKNLAKRNCTGHVEQAIYDLLAKYGIKPKTHRGGKAYFNKANAVNCVDIKIFELKGILDKLNQQKEESYEEKPEDDTRCYKDNLLYSRIRDNDDDECTNESVFNFKNIVDKILK